MTRYFDPQEDEKLAAAEQIRSRMGTYSRSATADVAARIGNLHRTYPHVSPGVILSMGRAGHDADSEIAGYIAAAEVRRGARKRKGFNIGDVISGAAVAAKGATRAATTVLAAPLEGLQGGFRNVVSGAREDGVLGAIKGLQPAPGSLIPGFDFSQTTLSVAIDQGMQDERVDLGSGYFPGGSAFKEQAERARAAGTIDGHAITPGRFLADFVVEPGTKPYNILSGLTDASIAIFADPAGRGLGDAAKVRKGAKVLNGRLIETEVGLVGGARKTILPEKAAQWITGPDGRRLISYLAEEKDFNRMRALTKHKIDSETLVKLADADDETKVLDVLADAMRLTVGEKVRVPHTQLGMRAADVKRHASSVRLFQHMPGNHMDLDDLDDAVQRAERLSTNARLPSKQVAANTERMARTTSKNERFNVAVDILDQVETAARADKHAAFKMTTIFRNHHEDLRKFFVDEHGDNMALPWLNIGGDGRVLASPHLPSEFINRMLPLPDARAIRRATSKYQRVLNLPGVEVSTAVADFVTTSVFKPWTLIRGAWTVRVIGEEQIRMGASGLDSMIRHPLSAIAWATGRKGADDVLGKAFTAEDDLDEFGRAMSRGSAGFRDRPGVVRTGDKVLYRKGQAEYAQSWADELQQLRSDPVASRVAGGLGAGDRHPMTGLHGVDAVKDWFYAGTGRRLRQDIIDGLDEDGRRLMSSRDGANAYIDSVHKRIQVKAGDARVAGAIVTGELDGVPMRLGGRLNPKFVAKLDELAEVGPDAVKGDRFLTVGKGGNLGEKYDRAVEWAFNGLMSRPTNYLSRSPSFKQFYWQRVDDLFEQMTPDAQQKVIKAAREAGLDKRADMMAGKLGDKAWQNTRTVAGQLELEDVDLLAKGHGLDQTRKLLYDLSDRSQFFDITRNIFPFGEAWKEILTTWSRIGVENPATLRRAHQLISGARGEHSDGGRGFFYPNPQTGEEMFAIPGSGFLTEQLVGVHQPLEARAAGLNLFSSSILPGFGPVVTIPASKLLPDDPEWDGLRELMLPFGDPDTSGDFTGTFLPAWLQKFRIAFNANRSDTQERQWNSVVIETARYLKSTGEYEGQDERLLADTKEKAKWLYVIRGMAQSVLPSAPSPKFVAKDKDGRLLTTIKFAEEYKKLQAADPASATERFIEKFGADALLTTVGKSEGAAAPTARVSEWQRQHAGLAKRHRSVYGMFVPDPTGELDLDAYNRQFRTGERSIVTPDEAVRRVNERLGRLVYAQAQEKMPDRPNAEQRQWLRDVKAKIAEEYPGYDSRPYDIKKTVRTVNELRAALKEPELASTQAGQGLALYLKAREKAQKAAEGLGLASFDKAAKATHLREWLSQVGEQVVAEYPDFGEMWDRVLSREVTTAGA